ncbi:5-hydroxyisourate hydrolase [alpha proteobacterium U9-1i]|nr:5-hydroxyisourate hydrolase [alpha proteobacterium U9-1i]
MLLGKLTTHVLDTTHGAPAAGVAIVVRGPSGAALAEVTTNADGRCDRPLLEGDAFQVGAYMLEFAMADYFRGRGVALSDPPFLDRIVIAFSIADAGVHYHVPLLASPYGYSTYRGS